MGNIYAPKWHFKVAIKTVSLLRSPLLLFIVGSPRCNYFFNTHVMMRQFPNGALNPRVKKAMTALVVGFVVVNCQLQLINWQWRRASPFPPHFPANLFFACSFFWHWQFNVLTDAQISTPIHTLGSLSAPLPDMTATSFFPHFPAFPFSLRFLWQFVTEL